MVKAAEEEELIAGALPISIWHMLVAISFVLGHKWNIRENWKRSWRAGLEEGKVRWLLPIGSFNTTNNDVGARHS